MAQFQSEEHGTPDYINAMHCWILINEPPEISKMVIGLLAKKESEMDDLAYNIGAYFITYFVLHIVLSYLSGCLLVLLL